VSDQHVIAIDLGGTKLLAGVVDRGGRVLRRAERPTDVSSQARVLTELENTIEELLANGAAAVGVGIPSLIDQKAGRAVSSVNIPLAGVDIRAHLSEHSGLPVAIENDANAAALAEHRFGAGRGTNHMVLLTLGTGVGGGLVLDGRLYRGSMGAGAELGHVTIDVHGGPCQGTCPGIGHLESLASGTGASARALRIAEERPEGDLGRAAAAGQRVDARLVVELARAGPGDAREVLETTGTYLGFGIANYVNVFNPEVVVVGGGFGQVGELLLEPARRVVAERALSPSRDVVRIVSAELGPDAGLIGAAVAGFDVLDGGGS